MIFGSMPVTECSGRLELAEVKPSRGYSEINRIDQMRSITISCDINEKEGNAKLIVQSLQGGVPEFSGKTG